MIKQMYYFVMKKKEILLSVSTWMKLKDIILSEEARRRKTNTVCYHIYMDF